MAARNARRLLRLVNSLLDFSRLEARRERPNLEPLDLATLTTDIASAFRSAIESAGLTLRVDVDPDLPPVWADRDSWEKVVSNLISNAFKYTFEGEITVALRARPLHAELVVTDTGIGIPEAELPNLFKRFYRVPGARGRTLEGSGIGLAMVHELVNRMYGSVRVLSREGEGTTFTIWIRYEPTQPVPAVPAPHPLTAPPPNAPALAAQLAEEAAQWIEQLGPAARPDGVLDDVLAPPVAAAGKPTGQKGRIVVAEDNADLRHYLLRLLGEEWDVTTVGDGPAALEATQRLRPDVLLTDVMMPGLDGFELLQRIRQTPDLKHTPVVFLTARAGEEAAIEGLLAGADDYIAKPFSPRELVARLRTAVERARADAALRASEERQTFLLRLSDVLRSLTDPAAVLGAITQATMQYFAADRCYYCEIANGIATIRRDTFRDGLPSVAGVYPLDSFVILQAVIAAGQPFVVADVQTTNLVDEELRQLCLAMQVISYINVPIIKNGEPAGVLCLVQSTPRNWTAQEVELVQETAERTWAAVERAHTVEALARSEEKHRTLFESIDEGVSTMEVLFDGQGKAVDYRFLEVNPAHEAMSGVGPDIVGKRIREVMPTIEVSVIERIGRVALTGEPIRFEQYVSALDRWFDIYLSRIGGDGSRTVASVFNNITERKHREANLAFLVEVSQDLASLTNVDETMNALGARIGAHFRASQCAFGEVSDNGQSVTVTHEWKSAKVPSLKGTYRVADYSTDEYQRACEAGETFIVRDVTADPRINAAQMTALGIGAFVTVPLVRDGAFRFNLNIYDSAPRDWHADEIELMREITNRIWTRLERARAEEALRESQQRLRLALDAAEMGTFRWYPQEDRTEQDARILTLLGLREDDSITLAKALATRIHPDDRALYAAAVARALDPGGDGQLGLDYRIVLPDGSLRWLHVNGQTFFTDETPPRPTLMYGTLLDITPRKRREANLIFLAEVNADLAQLTSFDVTMTALCEKLGTHFGAAVCAFSPVDEAAGTVAVQYIWHRADALSPAGVYRLDDYHSAEVQQTMRAGQPEVVRDTAALPAAAARLAALGIGAFVNLPFVRQGIWLFILTLTASAPRDWRDDELDLLRELTGRIWTRLEQARAEEALRESETRLRALVENLPGGAVFVVNQELRYVLAAGEALSVAGFEPGDLIGRTIFEAMPPAMAADYEVEYRRALAGETFELEHEAHGRTLLSRGVPLTDATGKIYAALAVSYDITERKRAEAALRAYEQQHRADLEQQVQDRTAELQQESRDFLQATLDASMDMIQVFAAVRDEAGQIVDFRWHLNNHTSGSRYGAVRGESLLERNPGVVEEGIFDDFKRVIETGEPIQTERHYAHEQFDGWFFQSIVKLGDGVATTTTDISARKQAEAEVQRLHEAMTLAKK